MKALRLPFALAFVTAAMLSLVNVSAFKRGTVTSGTTFAVVSTTSAALALTSTSAMVDTATNSMMRIDFRKGNGASRDFLSNVTGPPAVTGDLLQMRDVFRITNNGGTCQSVSVYVSSGTPTNLTGIDGRLSAVGPPGTQLAGASGAQTANRVLLGVSGSGKEQMIVDVNWLATSTATSGTFAIRVASTYSVTCP